MFSITTYMNFQLAEQVNANSEWLSKSTVVIRSSNRYQRNILNTVSGLRGYLFTGETFFVQAYDSAITENEGLLRELRATVTEEGQRDVLDEIAALNRQWVDGYAFPLIEAKKKSTQSDSSLVAFNDLYRERLHSGYESQLVRKLNSSIRDFINYEYSFRDGRKIELDESVARTRSISIFLTSFSIMTGFAIAVFLAHRISQRIMKMVNMADSIAGGNYNVSMEDRGKDELSHLASSLNHMATVLNENITLLERKNRELDQFAHIVSHDMKAPLRGIDNVVTWIEEDHMEELTPKVKEYIDLIRSRITRGENLINGILSYSRVGRYAMEKEMVDVNSLVEEMRESAMSAGLHLDVPKKLPTLHTHRIPLHQVLTNLIGNAIKYHNKKSGYIKVYHTETTTDFRFFVEDNGPGIAETYHEKIFGIFQTLNGSDSFESTGVGLAIVKKILDDYNQEINIQSAPGKGSVFSFTWPKELQTEKA
jgi:signal transduction histidine kinase